jgi:hypothetical protein
LKKYMPLFIALAVVTSLASVPAVAAGKSGVSGKSVNAHLYLYQKDPATWTVVSKGAWGDLQYKTAGPTFNFVFNGKKLAKSKEYCLIYYADFAERYTIWGGNNPGALIARGFANKAGNLHLAGSVNLNLDLPDLADANASLFDYSLPPDNYKHVHGAKLWLVPADCYDAAAFKVTTWAPESFLFESDLITYDDTDYTPIPPA